MARTFYGELAFETPTGVYEPREDSFIGAETLNDMELHGKELLDVGTGCGFLAVIAASEGADATATDVNPTALHAAEENATANDITITTIESDLFDDIDQRYDIIVFNAPYLPGDREDRSMEELAWYGGDDGREIVDRFITQAPDYLQDGGDVLLIQSSVTGIDETVERFEQHGFKTEVAGEKKVAWERLVTIHAWKI